MTGVGNLLRYERYRKAPRTPRSAHARYYYTRSLVLESPGRKPGPTRTRCQSAPRIMDSHSRSASPREPMRPQIRPPSPPSPAAFDNRAYQHDEADPNHNESFTSNGPANGTQNGHKPNGDAKLEAVNLELINLTPKNGTKKDTAVDMNASNPYDEYFVPVNEHRKFMRGEKLYVTADKRGEKGGCKRPLCWTLLVLVVAAVVAVIVLAATGILFAGSPTTLEQYNTTISSARAFGGVVHDHNDHDHSGHDHSGHDHSGHDHSAHDHATEPTETQHGPETQSDEANVHITGSDESDMSMYVPRTLEGELKIDNEEFSPALEDTDSNEYRDFVASFTEALKHAVFDRNTLNNGDNDVSVEVIQLRKGSVVVTYRIHWTPKPNADPSSDLLTADLLKTKLDNYLEQNNRMINVYHVAEEITIAKLVLDICQIDNNMCEHACEFDETTLEFTCTCPHGQILDINNPKRCMSILENAYPIEPVENKDEEVKMMTVDSNPSTTKPIPDEEDPDTKSVHIVKEHFDWKEIDHAIPETTTESEAGVNFSHIFGRGDSDQKTEAPIPEPAAEPNPTAEPTAELEPTSEPVAEPEPNAEPAAEPAVEPTAEPTTEPAAVPTAEPAAEPTPEPEPTSKPEPAPAAEPTSPENEHNLEVIPSKKSEPSSEHTTEPGSTPEPKSEPTPEPTSEPEPFAEPKAEPEPTAEPETKTKSEPELEPKSKPEPKPDVGTELQAEPEPRSEPSVSEEPTTIKMSSTEASSISDLETILSKSFPETSEREQNTDHESNSNEKPTLVINEDKNDVKTADKLETTTTRVSISEPNFINEPSYEPAREIDSIFSKHSPVPDTVFAENSENTTEINDWLEDKITQSEKHSVIELGTVRNEESEKRSFKSIDIFDEVPTTTVKIEISPEDLSDVIKQSKDHHKTEEEVFTNAPTENNKATTMKTSSMEETTDKGVAVNKDNMQVLITEMPSENNDEKSKHPFTNESTITTPGTKTEDEHSISKQIAISGQEKQLIEALNHKDVTEIETTTESKRFDENMDTTFETINSLLNRSSKSPQNQSEIIKESTDSIKDVVGKESTTESDWLSEPVTEMNYEKAINKVENRETTESATTKVEELVSNGKSKEDFEPEYLNSMSSNNNKMIDQNEPLNVMSIDYDSEDSRVKRVNKEKENTTEATANEKSGKAVKNSVTEAPMPVDATTVVEYIYKSSANSIPEPVTQMNIGTMTSTQATTEETKPAPVWEESEGDLTVKELPKTITINEQTTTARVIMIDEIVIPSELSSTPKAAAETTSSQVTESSTSSLMPDTSTLSGIQTVSSSDAESQNTTQVSNLNVTIYEISRHNSSLGANKVPNTQATDFEDHETEMNPFLPEAENNKVLVKNLQEGHDIEPNNLTETQNENIEEHSSISEATANQANINVLVKKLQEEPNNLTETQNINIEEHGSTSEATATQTSTNVKPTSTMAPVVTETQVNFTELEKSSHENKTEGDKVVVAVKNKENTTGDKETVTISTFLLDTDDLDLRKEHTTEHKTTIADNTLDNGVSTTSQSLIPDDNSDNLSVVPIVEERMEKKEALQKSYNSESMQELNDISDSPKKSDRRTLDENKFDSVLNNEA